MTVKLERHPVVICPCLREQRKASGQAEEGPEARVALVASGEGERAGVCHKCGAVFTIAEPELVQPGRTLPPLVSPLEDEAAQETRDGTAPPPPGDAPPPPVND